MLTFNFSPFPSLETDLTNNSNGTTFNRKYRYTNFEGGGIKTGMACRVYLDDDKKIPFAGYFQLKTEFISYYTSGIGYYVDKSSNGIETASTEQNFYQKNSGFLISLGIGFELQVKRKVKN